MANGTEAGLKSGQDFVSLDVVGEFDAELHLMDPVCVFSAGAAGPRLFTIHQIDANTNNLPKAHTWCVPHVPADIFIMIMGKNYPFQSLIHMNTLFSTASIGLTFRPTRATTSCMTSC